MPQLVPSLRQLLNLFAMIAHWQNILFFSLIKWYYLFHLVMAQFRVQITFCALCCFCFGSKFCDYILFRQIQKEYCIWGTFPNIVWNKNWRCDSTAFKIVWISSEIDWYNQKHTPRSACKKSILKSCTIFNWKWR